MENIERMKPSQTYEVMDLWLRTTIHSNSFVEENFWETHYDFVKEKYINGKENFVYIIDGKIVAFTGVTEDNRITGLFVDPEYQNKLAAEQKLKANKEKMDEFLNSTFNVSKSGINNDFNAFYKEKENSFIKAVIDENNCIGCTKCIQACPVDAIVGATRAMHTVMSDLCTGCNLCVDPCPTHCISLQPVAETPDSWKWDLNTIPVRIIPVEHHA